MDSPDIGARRNRYRRLLVGVGLSWLVLAAVLLLYQRDLASRVEIRWETATEQDTAGFNLYRSLTEEGGYTLVNEGEFIESHGSAVSGASYTYVDEDVEAGKTYYYVLEEIETDGSRTRYEEDRFKYVVPAFTGWLLMLSVLCASIAVVMVIAGLRGG